MSAILPVRAVEKPWGKASLPEPFAQPQGEPIGEIWFEPPAQLPELLAKYIFTSEALSVQVHPSDAQTLTAGIGRQGKEECWLIVDAEPGAVLGIGFRQPVDAEAMRKGALDGNIEDMLQWHPAKAGDFFYIPANTVHAIGAGISLIEVQQNSDITYRLYDYGRPRELHLDDGLKVAKGEPYPARFSTHIGMTENARLVDGPLFRLDQVAGQPAADTFAGYEKGPVLAIPRRGDVRIGSEIVSPGDCALAKNTDAIVFTDEGTCLIAQPCHRRSQ